MLFTRERILAAPLVRGAPTREIGEFTKVVTLSVRRNPSWTCC